MRIFSKKEFAEGKKILQERRIGQILFSEGTYQVEILVSKKQSLWPFIQLDDLGNILDAFCTCNLVESSGSCPHLAAAYLRIMNQEPLHVRFRESLWNQIGLLCAERHGYDPRQLTSCRGGYEGFSQTNKSLFWIHATQDTKEALEKLLFERPLETEETSLKFSNLPKEELLLWREGRPSSRLSYELSFWADLAKWWMFTEEEGAYTLQFSSESPPQLLTVNFPNMQFSFYIDLANWPRLIPPLEKVDSPLKVHPYTLGELKKIAFSKETGELFLDFSSQAHMPFNPFEKQVATKVGDWLFFPEEGFYPREIDPLLKQKAIAKSEVATFFKRHLKLLQKHLTQEKIYLEPVPVNYFLHIQESQALTIEPYLFEKGDLTQEQAHYFGGWCYLPDKGFFPLENALFEGTFLEIEKEKVSDFVNRHRVWLNSFEGFETHIGAMESHLGYKVTKDHALVFFTRAEFSEENENIIDFGEWVYVQGKGFYAKVSARAGAFVKAGVEVSSDQVSNFIHKYTDELETIVGFFALACPLEKTGLNICFNQEGRIQTSPQFFFYPQYKAENVQIFGDYTYVDKEGFALIAPLSRLPDNYCKERVIDASSEPYFVGYELELLYPYVLTIDKRLKRPSQMGLRLAALKHDPSSKTGPWVIDLHYETNIGIVSAYEIWQAIWRGKQYIFSDAGLIFLRQRRFEWLRLKNKKRWLNKGLSLRLTTLEFLRLSASEILLEPTGESKKEKSARKLFHDFLALIPPKEIDLTGLKSQLRPYQKVGVQWLWFLFCYGLSGLLCDEMGLGKTHQALALVAGIKNSSKKTAFKFLVVCPTSVIYHWENLIRTFFPEVRLYVFHGIERRFDAFTEGEFDLLLTSYGIVRTEQVALSNHPFDLAIFDELQVAKNEKSLTHKALRNISATMRLGLTGTPIENRILELKALFDLIVPTYFPSTALFRETFVHPIEKHQDQEKKKLLKRFIHPFLLRRKKSEVLTELPEKIEEMVLCDLSDQQHALYQEVLQNYREGFLRELKDFSKPPPIVHIFSMLSKLKQICNHPCLFTKDLQNYKEFRSGKWDLFLELLSETLDSGQKLVIFSQYIGMLDIMQMHLKEHKIEFAEIRGSTVNRREQVERFSNDPNCKIFLGSLQAAGVGIDLISASVVIHYDRWWNPAKENQATDRVHRMGQKRGVQVFKLVTKGTIEEHVHQMIENKMALVQEVMGFDEHGQVKGLNREDLIKLLQMLS